MAKPRGVRIKRSDGTEEPVELTHMGELMGNDTWGVPESYAFSPRAGDALMVDVFPAHTAIEFIGSDMFTDPDLAVEDE